MAQELKDKENEKTELNEMDELNEEQMEEVAGGSRPVDLFWGKYTKKTAEK